MSAANEGSCPSACWQPTDCFCRPGAKQAKCRICRKPFVMERGGWRKTKVMVREHRVSRFRGDDVVEFAHPSCVANAPALPPQRSGGRQEQIVGNSVSEVS